MSYIFGYPNNHKGMKMKFGLLGASKTGTTIAYHLWKKGWQPEFLWNRSKPHLERTLGFVPFQNSTTDISHYRRNCDLIIISVSDNAIKSVAHSFLKLYRNQAQVQIFHTSGVLDSAALLPHQNIGSFHPVISISSIEEGIRQLPATTFTCEGK